MITRTAFLRIAALLTAMAVLTCAGFSAAAVTPGPLYGREDASEQEALQSLLETKAGFKLDQILASFPLNVDPEKQPIANDPQVKRITEAWTYEAKPGDPGSRVVSIDLTTNTEEELRAFMKKYEKAEYILRLTTNSHSYIPESGLAVLVDLRFYTDLTNAEDPAAYASGIKKSFSPGDFSAQYVKNVYVSNATGMLPEAGGDEAFGAMREGPVKQALADGVPLQLALELKDHSYQNAAAFALALIDFENSDLFTQEQKANFRRWIADVKVSEYDFVTGNGLKDQVDLRYFRVWTNGGATGKELMKAAGITDETRCSRITAYGDHAIWRITPDAGADVRAVAGKLKAIPAVYGYECHNGITGQAAAMSDATTANLLYEAVTGPGDVNGDGKITAADARLALRAAVKLENLPVSHQAAANVDGKDGVTAADARIILRAAVKLSVEQPLWLTVRQGQTVTVGPLQGNDGGFLWTASPLKLRQGNNVIAAGNGKTAPLQAQADDDAGLTITEQYTALMPPLPGSAEYVCFQIAALKKGEYTVKLTLARPWNGETQEERRVNIKVL